ncbi:signal peptidase complex-like protein DTM1 isoform X2 [Corylus avellana]|uniref:signal peptidase complex-like protein DTM1 isoform X1 n=1 Tax=Corylus avellana TaxID=13451 RepID=UPI00286BC85F|nr:signal peptidase complex-like protein DTM1 isoform X1 [Corylus avellana]XP_059461086.1 signal peptidase complex-like protein DTM1 isoform X2 [Corylus avellana]
MANDAVLRSCLICLAAIILVVGICTQSFKKMVATYVVGVLGIAGVILPDWAYFNRDFSRWTSPMTAEERAAQIAQRSGSKRFRIYYMRVAIYTTVYALALNKWWTFVSN